MEGNTSLVMISNTFMLTMYNDNVCYKQSFNETMLTFGKYFLIISIISSLYGIIYSECYTPNNSDYDINVHIVVDKKKKDEDEDEDEDQDEDEDEDEDQDEDDEEDSESENEDIVNTDGQDATDTAAEADDEANNTDNESEYEGDTNEDTESDEIYEDALIGLKRRRKV